MIAAAFAFPSGVGEGAEERPILHVYWGKAKGEICVIDGGGTDRHCVTDNNRFDYDVVWSPDGTRIAFVEQTNNPRNPDIYVMDADGSGKRRLTRSRRDDEEPQWSPDGTQIVWNRHRGDSTTGKFLVMNADGTGKHLLTDDDGDDTSARWSPSGDQIAFMSKDPCSSDRCTDYQFDVHVVDVDGSDERRLTETEENEIRPIWSPDGSKIVFEREVDDEGPELFLMNSDGSDAIQLTDSPGGNFVPAWSPDGSQIAFTQITDPENFETRLGIVDVETRDFRILTGEDIGGVEPTWSPDGTYIAFSGHRSLGVTASYEIHTIRPDGSELRRLTRTQGDEFQLHWGS